MNIGQLMRGLLGDRQPGETKALELKIGQIVRGVIMQMLEGDEALVQINGVQVRAKLEANVQPGQSTMLQVQPQSTGDSIVLKPVELSAVLTEDSLKDLVKSLGLPDKKWATELVAALRRDGVPLTRELGQAMTQALAVMPAGADPAEWMQAASTAFKRGLPVTASTITSLQQVMFGKPLHELLQQVQTQLQQALASQPGGMGAAAARLQTLLADGAALMRLLADDALLSAPAGRASAASGQPGAAGASGVQAANVPTGGGAAGSAAQAAAAAAAAAAGAQGSAAAAGNAAAAAGAGGAAARPADGVVLQLFKWLGVDHERQLTRAVPGTAAGTAEAAKAGGDAAPAGRPATGADGQAQNLPARPAEAPPTPPAAPGAAMPAAERAPGLPLPVPGGAMEAPAADPARPAAAQLQESLKSVLMALSVSDDVPPALREAAQQLVSHITGQQLLLSAERGSTMLSHITMFIPFNGPDGEQTASVHIQSRRGRKGELDPENCRLLFDLRMKQLGDTLVDVQVVDRIVSLNVWNDHPAVQMILDTSRDEIAGALQGVGYQLLALRTTPLPDPSERASAETSKAINQQPPQLQSYSSKPYKGMDLRV